MNNCSSCKFWIREKLRNYPEPDTEANIGTCSMLENDLQYWDANDVAQEKIQNGRIGCTNLYTHKNFGCIHFTDNL